MTYVEGAGPVPCAAFRAEPPAFSEVHEIVNLSDEIRHDRQQVFSDDDLGESNQGTSLVGIEVGVPVHGTSWAGGQGHGQLACPSG